jgi:hypothetical protein
MATDARVMYRYAMADEMGRFRQIKYTPEHMHCVAIFYGPITPPNSGVICFQSTRNDQSHFRVSATGRWSQSYVVGAQCWLMISRYASQPCAVYADTQCIDRDVTRAVTPPYAGTVSELDRSFQVVKKLKIIGHPYKGRCCVCRLLGSLTPVQALCYDWSTDPAPHTASASPQRLRPDPDRVTV